MLPSGYVVLAVRIDIWSSSKWKRRGEREVRLAASDGFARPDLCNRHTSAARTTNPNLRIRAVALRSSLRTDGAAARDATEGAPGMVLTVCSHGTAGRGAAGRLRHRLPAAAPPDRHTGRPIAGHDAPSTDTPVTQLQARLRSAGTRSLARGLAIVDRASASCRRALMQGGSGRPSIRTAARRMCTSAWAPWLARRGQVAAMTPGARGTPLASVHAQQAFLPKETRCGRSSSWQRSSAPPAAAVSGTSSPATLSQATSLPPPTTSTTSSRSRRDSVAAPMARPSPASMCPSTRARSTGHG